MPRCERIEIGIVFGIQGVGNISAFQAVESVSGTGTEGREAGINEGRAKKNGKLVGALVESMQGVREQVRGGVHPKI